MVKKTDPKWRLDRRDKFLVLHRDEFTCRYCGARPGSELLEVDHLVPRSRGGLDSVDNLVSACRTCNGRKSDSIVFPHDLIERKDQHEEGWFIHKTFGEWAIAFCATRIGIENSFGYGFIGTDSWPDRHYWELLHEKGWPFIRLDNLFVAAAHLGRLVKLP